jgi:hypothetical protein
LSKTVSYVVFEWPFPRNVVPRRSWSKDRIKRYKLFIGDVPISIPVVPEHVSRHVPQLVLVLLQYFPQRVLNLSLVEQLVPVFVELDQQRVHPLSDCICQHMILEHELNLLGDGPVLDGFSLRVKEPVFPRI